MDNPVKVRRAPVRVAGQILNLVFRDLLAVEVGERCDPKRMRNEVAGKPCVVARALRAAALLRSPLDGLEGAGGKEEDAPRGKA